MKTFISLSIVIVFALITLWLQDAFKETTLVPEQKQKHFPDYFMDGFAVTQMNKQGLPAYVFRADRLQHYSDNNSSEITAPHIEIHDERGNWSIVAERAVVYGETDIIHLYDQVKIRREQTPQQEGLAIDTSYLKIDTRKKIAETDHLAHVSTSTLELDTNGMVFDSTRDILKLTSNVRGIYAPPK
ncbi:MAG: LPS export ABC transporter periplasmic protein LptC [Gammaproteobacteria bacterium]|nr:LPS export ABC transporter periplasmic protein LptC [Gammaproteobacteria bacterium]